MPLVRRALAEVKELPYSLKSAKTLWLTAILMLQHCIPAFKQKQVKYFLSTAPWIPRDEQVRNCISHG